MQNGANLPMNYFLLDTHVPTGRPAFLKILKNKLKNSSYNTKFTLLPRIHWHAEAWLKK